MPKDDNNIYFHESRTKIGSFSQKVLSAVLKINITLSSFRYRNLVMQHFILNTSLSINYYTINLTTP